jgi:hypothetical protein
MAIYIAFDEYKDSQDASITKAGGRSVRTYLARWYNSTAGKYISSSANVSPEEALIQFAAQVADIGSQHPVFTNPYIELVDIRAEAYDRFAKVIATWEPVPGEETANAYGEIWRFRLGTQETQITSVSEESLATHYPIGVKHDLGMSINVDDQGNVNGVMVKRPSLAISVEKKVPNSNFDTELGFVQARLNTINSATWRNYAIGEVLFLGADINKTSTDEWTFIYNFEVARQQLDRVWEFYSSQTGTGSDKVVTTTSETITINPWDYVWFQFEKVEFEDGDGNKTFKRYIRNLHIATVYQSSNFGTFNLHAPDA